MNIVMVSGHGCIRAQKMAIPLIERGHNVHMLSRKLFGFRQQFKTHTLCDDVEQMLEAMRLHADSGKVDVFHVHNEPSWYVTALKEITDKPVILDVHDSYLARSTPEEAKAARDNGGFMHHIRETVEERNNFQLADGLVFPGKDFADLVTNEFSLDQPQLVLPSYVPKRFYQYSLLDWHGGLVYEGKVNLPDETKGQSATGFHYCDYTKLSDRCRSLGMDFHIYAGRNDDKFVKHYDSGNVHVHEPAEFESLMSLIGRHDWGLVGNIEPTREWQVAMPNKLFEYMAAQVPVVALNADSCANFIREHGVGIVVDSLGELAGRWSEHRACRARLTKVRQNWSMNAHIPKLENFYEEIKRAA